MSIRTREELSNALRQAAELEHALLSQYLFAALTLKKSGEGLTPPQEKLARAWEAEILLIAREEMGHLAIVFNLLAAIGEPAALMRPPLPRQIDYYPFPFDLLPFGDEALHRFLTFELPRDHPPPPPPGADLRAGGASLMSQDFGIGPEPIDYKYVGELYSEIKGGFAAIPEKQLFIGPAAAQTDDNWSDPYLDIRVVNDKASAIAAIDEIIEDGEGSPNNTDDSHYRRFEKIRLELFDAGRFSAARAVVKNPATRSDPAVSGTVTLITNPQAMELAKLFNITYAFTLSVLQYYFTLAPVDDVERARRERLRECSQRLMSIALRPLAEILTKTPVAPNAASFAGPPFELYSTIAASPYPGVEWTILLEEFERVVSGCEFLAATFKRLGPIAETLEIMRKDLVSAA
ncbi:MAG: ferritin-like domain-containing protein [Terricaulis sp.]